MTQTKINTKYGTAYLNSRGYYILPTEGNNNKLLHRVIFEEHYQCELPADTIIHHIDGDKTNNHISNLMPLTPSEHSRIHTHNESSKKKQSESKKGVPKTQSHKDKISETLCLKKNTSGYYRVRKEMKNGKLYWRYRWQENGKDKSITRKTIYHLKKEVLARGLEWFEIEDGKKVIR